MEYTAAYILAKLKLYLSKTFFADEKGSSLITFFNFYLKRHEILSERETARECVF